MPVFRYKAVDSAGDVATGEIEAANESEIVDRLRDQVLGALDVQQEVIGGLGQQDADLLLAVANQVAIALRNARQFAETQQNIAHKTQVDAIIQQIQGTTSIESALQVAAREIGRALNAQRTRASLGLGQVSDGKN